MAGDAVLGRLLPARPATSCSPCRAADGSWNGDGIGQVYGTAIAVIILQLPYKYLPVFQR